MLQRFNTVRFETSWEGCLQWASGLVHWHLAERPETWAPLSDRIEHAETYIEYARAVVACALHATAVDEGLDSPDGATLLAVPLAPAAALLDERRALDTLVKATPPDPQLSSLLHSIPVWIEVGDESARSKGEFLVDQARDVLTAHAEYGHAVGDRMRAVLRVEDNQEVRVKESVEVGPEVYLQAQSIELHQQQVASLQAMCAADQLTQTTQAGPWQREFQLHRAAIADRLVLELGDSARPSSRSTTQELAEKLLAWDRSNQSSAGPVPAADPRWDSNALGYVRQEFAADLEAKSRPLLE